MEIRDPKLPKSIKPVYHFYNILYNIDRKKEGTSLGIRRKKRDEKLKNYGQSIEANLK
ncbi:MAG: hypothetical protein M3224_03345 [Thermoproteota archaeon]|nr:hypothetical protein [Thermoproteota archaeon]